jgi:hypothetical protein
VGRGLVVQGTLARDAGTARIAPWSRTHLLDQDEGTVLGQAGQFYRHHSAELATEELNGGFSSPCFGGSGFALVSHYPATDLAEREHILDED